MKELRVISDNPKHRLENFKWDWCFRCNAIHARCPRCDVNSCSCACPLPQDQKENGACPEQGWWDAQYGEEYKEELAARPRPERDKLIKFIEWINSLTEETEFHKDMACDPLDIVNHALWHGIDFTFNIESKDDKQTWSIVINKMPTDEPRPVYYPQRLTIRKEREEAENKNF